MRNVLSIAFLVGIASVTTALATPIAANSSVAPDTMSRAEVTVTRSEAGDGRSQRSLQAQSESKTERSEGQLLSKNFPRAKPVQIYWFFGGR